MFRFNFGGSSSSSTTTTTRTTEEEKTSARPSTIILPKIIHAEESNINSTFPKERVAFLPPFYSECGDTQTVVNFQRYMRAKKSNDPSPLSHVIEKSDLQPGVYEGGFKLWECAVDLTRFLIESKVVFKDKKVLELGTGQGIPSIYTLFAGASEVVFQDYNEEVLNQLTIPNVYLNLGKSGIDRSKFVSGDWSLLSTVLKEEDKYDFILMSDTLYSLESYPKIFNVIENHLLKDGTVYVASKTYYFGVGGGIRLFEDFIEKTGKGRYVFNSLKTIADGTSNMREIVKIERNKNP